MNNKKQGAIAEQLFATQALRRGFGVEDIAVILRRRRMRHATVKAVRAEVSLLRAEGKLMEVLGIKDGTVRTAQGREDH